MRFIRGLNRYEGDGVGRWVEGKRVVLPNESSTQWPPEGHSYNWDLGDMYTVCRLCFLYRSSLKFSKSVAAYLFFALLLYLGCATAVGNLASLPAKRREKLASLASKIQKTYTTYGVDIDV